MPARVTRFAVEAASDNSERPASRELRRYWLIAFATAVGLLSLVVAPVAEGATPGVWKAKRVPRLPGPAYTMIGPPRDAAAGRCLPPTGFPGLPVEGRVIGVVDDPLSGYAAEVSRLFPGGVPLSERGYVRDLMRARMAREVLDTEFVPVRPAPAPGPYESAMPPSRHLREVRPLQRIEASAVPVRTGGGADWDALSVSLAGFDADGDQVPVRGTARVVLWGMSQRLSVLADDHLVGSAGPIKQIATWSRAIEPPTGLSAGQGSAARVVLPLPATSPDHDPRTFPLGAVQVELLVPGEGTYTALVDGVPLQQLGPLRSRALLEYGSRFLPGESTSRSRRVTGPTFRQSSSIRPESRILTVEP